MTERKELIERLRELAEDKVLSVNYCVAVSHAADMLEADAPAVPQEPVAIIRCWTTPNGEGQSQLFEWCDPGIEALADGEYKLYAAPQPQPRLTDAEIDDLAVANTLYSREVHIHSFARAIEAKIRSEQA
jgi:hypothetical protein